MALTTNLIIWIISIVCLIPIIEQDSKQQQKKTHTDILHLITQNDEDSALIAGYTFKFKHLNCFSTLLTVTMERQRWQANPPRKASSVKTHCKVRQR